MESGLGPGKWKVMENQPNGCHIFDPCTPKHICWPGSTWAHWGSL